MATPTLNNPLGARASATGTGSFSNASLESGDLWACWLTVSNTTISDLNGWDAVIDVAVASTRRFYFLTTTDFTARAITFGAGNNHGFVHAAIKGMDSTDPIDPATPPTPSSNTTGGTITCPAITTTVDEVLIARSLHKMANGSGVSFAQMTGHTEVYDVAGTGSAGHGIGLQTIEKASAGLLASETCAVTGDSANAWAGSSVGFAPQGIILPAGQFLPFF